MPVAGKEETAVKPVARLSSDYIAGIPIKKRRFPLYQPSSPIREDPSSHSTGNDSLQKEHPSISQGSTRSNANVETSSLSLSDSKKNSGSEERKVMPLATTVSVLQNAGDNVKVKVEEPYLRTHSSSLDHMAIKEASKEKLLVAEFSAGRQINCSNTELQLASKEGLTFNVGKVINRKENAEEKCCSDTSTITGNIELSLGLKEHTVPSLGRQDDNRSFWNQESSGPLSLNLSLSERTTGKHCERNGVHLSTDSEKMPRSNWDLNTTMDAWDGPVRDAAEDQLAVDGLNTTSGMHDVKPMVCSSLMARAGVVSGSKFIEKSEHRPNTTGLPTSNCQQYNSIDALNLRLSPSCHQPNYDRESSSTSGKVDSSKVVGNINLPTSNLSSDGRTVKPEPFDESVKHYLKVAKDHLMGLEDSRAVKREFVDRCNQDSVKSLSLSAPHLENPKFIKSETCEANLDTLKKVEGISHQSGKQAVGQDNQSSILQGTKVSQMSCSLDKSACSTELNRSGDVFLGKGDVPLEASGVREVASGRESVHGVHDGVCGMSEAPTVEDNNCKAADSNFMNEVQSSSRANGGVPVSDEEKVNISGDMLEEVSYGTDYDSDGNHAVTVAMDTEQCGDGGDDDYEDGEVRDPEVQTAEGLVCVKNVEHFNSGNLDCKGNKSTSPNLEEENTRLEDPVGTNNDQISECVDVAIDEQVVSGVDKFVPLQDSAAVQIPISELDNGRAMEGKSLDVLDKKDGQKDPDMEQLFDQGFGGSEGTLGSAAQGVDERERITEIEGKSDSAFPKLAESLNADDDATKDVSSGGNRSRIINLSQASNASSPGTTRYISGRPLPSQAGRDRLSDVVLDGEKLHPQGRDEVYMDSPHKFSRERHQDQTSRNSRFNFTRGRGRGSNRLDTGRGDWNSGRDFAPDFYSGPTAFRGPRHKYGSAGADADLEYSTYNMGPDTRFIGTGRRGRKVMNDEGQIFSHVTSRRRSPGGRDGPAGRGIQMARRGPRNVSPGRCIGEDGSEIRRNEKFLRGFPDDNVDPVFSRSQHPYMGVDGHFMRGNRNFSSAQRRGPPRIRSKSPIRSRTRSPGPWSSPRRRSPDGFGGGHPEIPHKRSPAIFRIERERSPDRPCFPGDMVARRRSPPYLARPNNDPRDMEPGREHGHPRSVIPNRSPTGRVLLRNNRRFDVVDPRDRAEGDEYFGGPMHSGRFHELGGDANGENRRRFAERRGPIRSFRPPYNGADGDNFNIDSEEAPRPFRFCPEDDSQLNERGNMREREFDRRIKNRPGNAPRSTRNIEEQEGNFRNSGQEGNFRNAGPEGNFRNGGGQAWGDEGFDGISRVKRKRF